jgi:hypothetical protein
LTMANQRSKKKKFIGGFMNGKLEPKLRKAVKLSGAKNKVELLQRLIEEGVDRILDERAGEAPPPE